MKITMTFELPSPSRDVLLAALRAMLKALPPSIKVEITEQRKTTLYGGESYQASDAPLPIEEAIEETHNGATETRP